MGQVVAVVGARGGVGASTLAALLARHLAADGAPVALVDLDHAAGGVEVLLGTEAVPGARWADLDVVRTALEPDDLGGVLPTWQGVEVLGHDRRSTGPPDPVVLTSLWPALGRYAWTVVDVPAGLAHAVSPQVLAGDRVILTAQDVVGAAAAVTARTGLGPGPVQLVLRSRARPSVSPAEVAHVVGLPVVGTVPTVRALPAAVDEGLGPAVGRARGRLHRAVARIAQVVGG